MDPQTETAEQQAPQVAVYNLSAKQNVQVRIFQEKLSAAGVEMQKAEEALNRAKEIVAEKQQTLDARVAAYQAELGARNRFFEYIVDEFDLPKPKDGVVYQPRENEPGTFSLYAEIDVIPEPEKAPEPENAPAKRREPRQEWKRRKTVELPKRDTNNPVEPQ